MLHAKVIVWHLFLSFAAHKNIYVHQCFFFHPPPPQKKKKKERMKFCLPSVGLWIRFYNQREIIKIDSKLELFFNEDTGKGAFFTGCLKDHEVH